MAIFSSQINHNNEESLESKGFWKQLISSYNSQKNDPEINRMSGRTCTIYFWLTAITEIYVMVNYIIPYRFANYTNTFHYYMKVLSWFVFIQTTANWACVKCYESACRRSWDEPHPAVTLQIKMPELSRNGDVQRIQDNESKARFKTLPSGNNSTGLGNGFTNGHNVSVHIEIDDVSGDKDTPSGRRAGNYGNYDALHWWWCNTCQCNSPPRSHHCKICNKCILKRDHHCYMTGVCIGYYNQRYFVVLSAYTAFASIGGLYLITEHLQETFTGSTYSDYVLPLTFYRWLVSGTIELHHFLMVFLVYTLTWSGFAGCGFLCWQLAIIAMGKTTFEVRKEIRVRCTSTVGENFRSVFGAFWGLNFLFPAQLLFRQEGDGTKWNIKPA